MSNNGAGIREYIYGEHLLLFKRDTKRLYALNSTSRLIWDLYKKNSDIDSIVEYLVSSFTVVREQAQEDCIHTISHWQQLGLVEFSAEEEFRDIYQKPTVIRASLHQKTPYKKPNVVKASLNQRTPFLMPGADYIFVMIAGLYVKICCDVPEMMLRLNTILNHLQKKQSGSIDLTISISREQDQFVIAVNEVPVRTTVSSSEVLGWVYYELIAHFYLQQKCLAILHAGAVYHNGTAILFPGSSGKGKSTLIAALQEQGFVYLCDDICPLTEKGGKLIPVPVSQSLKKKSWQVLSPLLPTLSTQPEHSAFGKTYKYMQPATGDTGIWEQSWPVKMIVFPEYKANSPLQSQILKPLQVLSQVIDSGSLFGENIPAVLQWLEDTPCFSLRYSSLHEATAWVQQSCRQQRHCTV